MYAYLVELVDRKVREPGDDLISRLVTEYIAAGQLDHGTAAITSVIMMQAGHETTAKHALLGKRLRCWNIPRSSSGSAKATIRPSLRTSSKS